MKHKHEVIEIHTEYTNNAAPEVLGVCCRECNMPFPEIQALLQARYDNLYVMMDNQPPVVFMNMNTQYVREITLYPKEKVWELDD